jgi:hypothetical protein
MEVSTLKELYSPNTHGDTFRARFFVVKATPGDESIVE